MTSPIYVSTAKLIKSYTNLILELSLQMLQQQLFYFRSGYMNTPQNFYHIQHLDAWELSRPVVEYPEIYLYSIDFFKMNFHSEDIYESLEKQKVIGNISCFKY